MTHSTLKLAALSVALLSSIPVNAADWTGNIGGYLGQKSLENNDWAEHDKQGSVGILFDIKQQHWPVSIAIDVFGSGNEDEDGDSKDNAYTAEAHIGVRKVFELPIEDCKLRPYIGAGVALGYAEVETINDNVAVSDDDTGNGYWVGVGTYFKVTENFNLGLDVRYSKTDLELSDSTRDAGGLNASLGVGYHW